MTRKGTIRKLDSTGDTILAEWDLTEMSLAEADRKFDELVASGAFLLSRCDEGTGNTGQQVKKFDPLADEIHAYPRFAGG